MFRKLDHFESIVRFRYFIEEQTIGFRYFIEKPLLAKLVLVLELELFLEQLELSFGLLILGGMSLSQQ